MASRVVVFWCAPCGAVRRRTKLFETVSITAIVRMFTALVQEQSIIVFANTVRACAAALRRVCWLGG